MLVDIKSAGLDAQLESSFGRPLANPTVREELFGPYVLNGEYVFWRYRAAADSWDVLVPDIDAGMSSISFMDDNDAYDQLLEAFDHLRTLPRPGFCSTPNEITTGQTFAFNGWRFTWYWIPQLSRWEIAERGRA